MMTHDDEPTNAAMIAQADCLAIVWRCRAALADHPYAEEEYVRTEEALRVASAVARLGHELDLLVAYMGPADPRRGRTEAAQQHLREAARAAWHAARLAAEEAEAIREIWEQ